MPQFRVRAVPREGFDGRNRSGRRFFSGHWTVLEEHELTEAILNDDLLEVEPVSEDVPAANTTPQVDEAAAAERARLETDLASATAHIGRLEGENGELRRAVVELQEALEYAEARARALEIAAEQAAEQAATEAGAQEPGSQEQPAETGPAETAPPESAEKKSGQSRRGA